MNAKHRRPVGRCLAAAILVLLVAGAASARPATPAETAAVRAALRRTDYGAAVRLADERIAAAAADTDEALYLRALALHHLDRHDEAIAGAERLRRNHPDSRWWRKALYLQARSLIEQRRFEAAEAIYEAEAHRLLGPERKHEIAGVLVAFADELMAEPDPHDVGAPPPDPVKAANLYARTLEMQIGRDLRDDVQFRLAVALRRAGQAARAIEQLRTYLDEFDPDWTGPVGSPQRMRGQRRENPPPAGRHVPEARYELGLAQVDTGQLVPARRNFEDLLTVRALRAGRGEAPPASETLAADAGWQIVRTWSLPGCASNDLTRGVKAARDFLAEHPRHPHAVEAAWLVAEAWRHHGRADDAVAAYEAFLAGEGYALPEGDAATTRLERLDGSPAELQERWRQAARYQIGEIRFAQKKYERAVEHWQRYTNRWPNGPQWAAAQRRIIDAGFMLALDAVAAVSDPRTPEAERPARRTEADDRLRAFLAAHPLDGRAPQVLFILGQMHATDAEAAEGAARTDAYRRAIDEWAKLISKYPGTEESGLALYRTGLLLEERLDDLDGAIDAYRRLTWSSSAPLARQRLAIMTRKHLVLQTERTFRTQETPEIRVDVRNVETVTVRQYFLDPAAYFRKRHTTGGVDDLDIALIEPDRTWEVAIDGYGRYRPLEQRIEIPFEAGRPGVCIVNVAEEELEATTLVIRSDLDLAMRTSRRESLVYVQDMVAGRPARDVDVLLSDGQTVFATGRTGADGVFRGGWETLRRADDLRVFAVRDGHVAANEVGLAGLRLAQGLGPKGYLYTDRPAYRPGQVVHARGVIREVADGSYTIPTGREYVVALADPHGRLLEEQVVTPSRFGTFHASFSLGDVVPVGSYQVMARPREGAGVTATASFEVQQFTLEKMELSFDFEREVVFRGETVVATIRAEYYWGEPVVDRPVRYTLPDGRTFVERTDREGRLAIEFDTSGTEPGRVLGFHAQIEGENVAAAGRVHLPALGFRATVTPGRPLAIAGEPFDVTVATTAPDGEPVGRRMTLFVLRRQPPVVDPVLGAVPWVAPPPRPGAEVTVEEREIETDAETGRAVVRLTLDEGGTYVLRAAGPDRFDQTVVAEGRMEISGDDDATKLRIFADSDTLPVGGAATVRLHSRLDAGLAVLTWEGESIIAHRIVELRRGDNPIELDVGHEHFPNFALSAMVLDDRSLYTATKPFTVERELKVAVRPSEAAYEPGATGTVELTVTDQLGAPVEAELSLALVDEALLALYPDPTPEIRGFFQTGARRHVEFRVVASNGFAYEATTRQVVKAFREEAERLALQQSEAEELVQMGQALREIRDGADAPADAQFAGGRMRRAAAPNAPASETFAAKAGVQLGMEMDDEMRSGGAGMGGGGSIFGDPGEIPVRHERHDAGWWSPAIVTDADGKAVVTLPMPEKTTRWRLVSRGVTPRTLVGQADATVVTRQEFFVEIKAPDAAMEGDQLAVLARVHNLGDYGGPVELVLALTDGDRRLGERRRTVEIDAGGIAEALFDRYTVPATGRVELTVAARGGPHRDAVRREIAVRPWGLAWADHGGGSATGSAALRLELPSGRAYDSRWLSVAVGPSVERAVIDLALHAVPEPLPAKGSGFGRPAPRTTPAGPDVLPPMGGSIGGDLLAAVSGLDYARQVGADEVDRRRLADRARSLVSALVASQHDQGGWGWVPGADSDWHVTCTSFWALCRAERAGLTVHPDTLHRAKQHLRQAFQQASAADHDRKAVILHALSEGDAAEFKLANTLYRQRPQLGPLALAYTALTLANLDRAEIAGEVLDVLETKREIGRDGDRTFCSWSGGARSYPWLNGEVDTTAIALLAYVRVRPSSPRVAEAVEFLLDRRGCFGFPGGLTRGAAVAALGAWFGQGRVAADDVRITVIVNDEPVRTIERRGSAPPVRFDVPVALVRDGANTVRFEAAGRGRYTFAATLRGFSPTFQDNQGWSHRPYVRSRAYHHAALTYRGTPISAASTSPVRNLEIGQRTRVWVDVKEGGYDGRLVVEEPLPAGTTLVPGSLEGPFVHHEVRDGLIVMYYPRGRSVGDYRYELAGYATGGYRVLPTVIRDAVNPSRVRIGAAAEVIVLAPDEASDDPYRMNDRERYELGRLHFEDGLMQAALEHLWPLFDREHKYNEREVARMLLWIHTSDDYFDAARVVDTFEVLSVRHPQLTIPFDRILAVGRAYRALGEFERAWIVFRATIDSSFLVDSNVAAVLQDEGRLLGSIDYQESLWWQYPDTAEVGSSLFALAQQLHENAPRARDIARQEGRARITLPGHDPEAAGDPPTRVAMTAEAIRVLTRFMTLYPENPLADDAAFSLANAYLDLKDYDTVVELSDAYRGRFPDSVFASSFQYMTA
ncbi:MAG: tetratricopeptide repeat protein, partial [Planctomycetota bacterium]